MYSPGCCVMGKIVSFIMVTIRYRGFTSNYWKKEGNDE